MPRDYDFWVYIVSNRNHRVLYIGVTNDLARRVWEHQQGELPGFTATYRCTKLLFYEHYTHIDHALAREKQLKGWRRTKKIDLIATTNPRWLDLSVEILHANS